MKIRGRIQLFRLHSRLFQFNDHSLQQDELSKMKLENHNPISIQTESTYRVITFQSADRNLKLNQSAMNPNENQPDVEVVSLLAPTSEVKACCYFCHGQDDIVQCFGGCNRFFHLRCIGMKAKKDMKTWKCRACSGNDLRSSSFHKKHCLRNWYFKDAVELSDGSHSVIIEGNLCYDESLWKCSPIDHLLDKSHIVTMNHSIYTLIVALCVTFYD